MTQHLQQQQQQDVQELGILVVGYKIHRIYMIYNIYEDYEISAQIPKTARIIISPDANFLAILQEYKFS